MLSKETGALLPLIFIVVLYRDPARSKYAAFYLAPFAALASLVLRALADHRPPLRRSRFHAIQHDLLAQSRSRLGCAPTPLLLSLHCRLPLGRLACHPHRLPENLEARRALLHAAPGRLSGVSSQRTSCWSACSAARRSNAICFPFSRSFISRWARHLSFYVRAGATSGVAVLASGLLAGLFFNPPFPFPYENNLALVDFVQLHRAAAQFLEKTYPSQTVYTAWPLTQALRNPAFGYVHRAMSAAETSDLHVSTLNALNPQSVDVLVLYSRTWEPSWGVLQWPAIRDFLGRLLRIRTRNDPRRGSSAFRSRSHPTLEPTWPVDRDLLAPLTALYRNLSARRRGPRRRSAPRRNIVDDLTLVKLPVPVFALQHVLIVAGARDHRLAFPGNDGLPVGLIGRNVSIDLQGQVGHHVLAAVAARGNRARRWSCRGRRSWSWPGAEELLDRCGPVRFVLPPFMMSVPSLAKSAA